MTERRSITAKERLLSYDSLRAALDYDPATGRFTWRGRKYVRALAEAGTTNADGYRRIKIDGVSYMAHRLAWFYQHQHWPADGLMIDHWDGDPSNNAIANLRLASASDNKANSRLHRNNLTGFKGVSYHSASGKWRARIRRDGRLTSLGLFASPEEAHATYCAAARQMHGAFARSA